MKSQLQKKDTNLDAITKKEQKGKNFFYFLQLWAFGEDAADAWLKKKNNSDKEVLEEKSTESTNTEKVSEEPLVKNTISEKDRERVTKEMDRVLADNDFLFFLKAIQNGYTPTKSQNERFNETIDYCIRTCWLAPLEKYLQHGYSLPSEKLVELFFSGDEEKDNIDLASMMDVAFRGNKVKEVWYPTEEKSKETSVFDKLSPEDKQFEETQKENQQKMVRLLSGLSEKEKEICIKTFGDTLLFKAIQEFAIDADTIPLLAKELIKRSKCDEAGCNLTMALYKFNDLLFPHLSRQQYQDICYSIVSYGNSFGNYYSRWDMSDYMKQTIDIYYPDHHDDLLNDIKSLYIEKKIDIVTASIKKEDTKKYTVKNLPEEAHTIVEKIEKHYQQLKHASLTVEDNTQLELTIDKRIPQLLHKYFSIHEEYRETMVNRDQKNALQLLVESLDNLESMLSDMMNRYQEQKLHDLTVDHRYTANIRKPGM